MVSHTPVGTQVTSASASVPSHRAEPHPHNHTGGLTLGAWSGRSVEPAAAWYLQDYLTRDRIRRQSAALRIRGRQVLMFSQTAATSPSPGRDQGLLTDTQVSVPRTFLHRGFPNSPIATTTVAAARSITPSTSYRRRRVLQDGKSALRLLNQNNTLTKIDLNQPKPIKSEIRVGNAPHSILINGAARRLHQQRGGRARRSRLPDLPRRTPIVADPVGFCDDGTSSGGSEVMKVTQPSRPVCIRPGWVVWKRTWLAPSVNSD